MKKIFFVGMMSLAMLGCEDDEPIVETPYPTDDLDLRKRKKELLVTGYAPGNAASVNYEIFRQINEYVYGERLNHLSLVFAPGHPLYTETADSVRSNFFGLTPPFFVVDNQEVSVAEVGDLLEDKLEVQPVLDVAHNVMENDTAWIVDSKVKFFEDTASAGMFIQTYMVANIQAKNYPQANLNVPVIQDLIVHQDSVSYWATNIFNEDSSETIIAEGDPYYHNWLVITAHNKNAVWGTNLGEYWPFGGEFYNGDVMGTKDTPIRHVFEKEEVRDEDDGFPFEFEPGFVTVVWIFNPYTLAFEHVNSFSTEPPAPMDNGNGSGSE